MSSTMANSYLHYIPAAIFITLPTTFVITYFWSIALDHVYPVLPNISETGALPPESCLFGMMLNLTAFTMLFAVYVRHKEGVEVFRAKSMAKTNPNAFVMNRISTITGVVACMSLDVVANFQQVDAMSYIHQLASVICFYSATLYLIQQTILSNWMVPEISGMWLVYGRWILSIVATLSVISDTVFTSISYIMLHSANEQGKFLLQSNATSHWTPAEPGYMWHCLSSATQWVVVCTLGSFILTFYWDFKKITIFTPELEMRTDPVPQPVLPLRFQSVQSN